MGSVQIIGNMQSVSTLLGIYKDFFFRFKSAVAHLRRGLMRCVIRDALLRTTFVMRGY